jgi:chromosomal replication initiation ATPase DnaA
MEAAWIRNLQCADTTLAIPSDRHMVRSWWHNQFLVKTKKVVIELIHVAYEV